MPGCRYNDINIRAFLSEKIDFNEFHSFLKNHFDRTTPIARIEGESQHKRAMSLFNDMKERGFLKELIFYSAEWWFSDSIRGSKVIFCDAKYEMHKALFCAAMDFLNENIETVRKAFDLIASFDADFKKICQDAIEILNKKALKEQGSAEDLIRNFKKCRQLYERALSEKAGKKLEMYANTLAEIESIQPQFKDVNQQLEQVKDMLDKCKQSYEKAMACLQGHDWIGARECFQKLFELNPNYSDTVKWHDCLLDEEKVKRFQRLIDISKAGFFIDERIRWQGDYPYQLFQNFHTKISPVSSENEIRNLFDEFKQSRELTEEMQKAFDALVETEERLFIDAFLFPACPPTEMVGRIVENGINICSLPDAETLIEFMKSEEERQIKEAGSTLETKERKIRDRIKKIVAAMLFIMGYPTEAFKILINDQKKNLTDGRTAHFLALLYTGEAQKNFDSDEDSDENAIENLRNAFGHWAVSLMDSAYWIKWGRERFQCYGKEPVYNFIVNIKDKIQRYLSEMIKSQLDSYRSESDRCKNVESNLTHLQSELDIEFKVTQLVQAIGGIEIETGRKAWFGPNWMQQYQLSSVLANYLAKEVPAADSEYPLLEKLAPGLSVEQAFFRLRLYFSYLGQAAIMQENDKPEDALKMVESSEYLNVPDCSKPDCPRHGKNKFGIAVCCPYSDKFEQLNPAWRAFEKPANQMCKDALQLVLEIRIALVRKDMENEGRLDIKQPIEKWETFFGLVHDVDESIMARLRLMILEITLPQEQKSLDSLTISINLIDLWMKCMKKNDPAMENRLITLLEFRAILKLDKDDISGALSDLVRALEYDTTRDDIRARLVRMYFFAAKSIKSQDRFLALDYLRLATEVISQGSNNYDWKKLTDLIEKSKRGLQPGWEFNHRRNEEEETALSQSAKHIDKIDDPAKLYAQGIKAVRENRIEDALDFFDRGLILHQEDPDIEKRAVEAIIIISSRHIAEGNNDEAESIIMNWKRKLSEKWSNELNLRLNFFKYFIPIEKFLIELKDFKYQVENQQQAWFRFEGQNGNLVEICLEVEKEDICLSATLPVIPLNKFEMVLENLLIVSSEATLFKIVALSESDVLWKTRIPAYYFKDPDRFFQTVFQLSEFADIPQDHLINRKMLQDWLRERKAYYSRGLEKNRHAPDYQTLIEQFCSQRTMAWERRPGKHYIITHEGRKFDIAIEQDGNRLSTMLGQLKNDNRLNVLKTVAEKNNEMSLGKFSMDESGIVILQIDLPYFNSTGELEIAFKEIENNFNQLDDVLTEQ